MGMQENYDAIRKALSTLKEVNYYTASELLPTLLANEKLTLDTSVFIPEEVILDPEAGEGIGRYELYDNPDPENPFSIWVFVIPKRHKTSIHDHKFEGTVTALTPVSEINYTPTHESESGEKFAKVDRCTDIEPFQITKDNLTKDDNDNPNVHQLKCRKDLGISWSITFHIYHMPARRIDIDGNVTVNRNLNNYYSKDPSVASGKRDYANFFNQEKAIKISSSSVEADHSPKNF